MQPSSVWFRRYRCFRDQWAGFDLDLPVTVILGRNNSGKSQLLELVAAMCGPRMDASKWELRFSGVLTEEYLRRVFPRGQSGGAIGGDYWSSVGRHLIGEAISWEIRGENIDIESGEWRLASGALRIAALDALRNQLAQASAPFANFSFRRISAERDISSEPIAQDTRLRVDGEGATNLIRRFLTSSSPRLPRDLIRVELLRALNEIFGEDATFTEIQVQHHDEGGLEGHEGHWEVFLGEQHKGLIALSRSGSGLKTVLLVLLNLIAIPFVEGKKPSEYVYAFEELENNLHPALLRRLLGHIERHAREHGCRFYLTTHSPAAIDSLGTSEISQLIRVTHDGNFAKTTRVLAHTEKLETIANLGARPSDLLQANGVIWLEGPSDRVYLNRWISLLTGSSIREGRDYQCAYYGGSLLATAQFTSPEDEVRELANLFHLNHNVIVVCDSDKSSEDAQLKERVMRIQKEVDRLPTAHIWVTGAKEIENYLTAGALSLAFKVSQIPDPGQFERFFPGAAGSAEQSFYERELGRRSYDKVELAALVSPHIRLEDLDRFDLKSEMNAIIGCVKHWNR